MTVYREIPEGLSRNLSHLRRAYWEADVFFISDGTDLPVYQWACAENAASYLPGSRLKTLENGTPTPRPGRLRTEYEGTSKASVKSAQTLSWRTSQNAWS
jgi:hypothetical protein